LVDIQTISIAIASAGVFAAAIYYIIQIRHQTKTRNTDMVMRLYTHSGSKEVVEAMHKLFSTEFKDYDDFTERYSPLMGEDPVAIALGMIIGFYEGIGILLHRKLVDVNLIEELFPVDAIWEKIKPLIEGARKQYNLPQLCEWFEYLYNELKKREQVGVKFG
jgi:hypothetical protein